MNVVCGRTLSRSWRIILTTKQVQDRKDDRARDYVGQKNDSIKKVKDQMRNLNPLKSTPKSKVPHSRQRPLTSTKFSTSTHVTNHGTAHCLFNPWVQAIWQLQYSAQQQYQQGGDVTGQPCNNDNLP
ncbi:hypothetical protein O6H91_Y518900 [Diphasiastrum complanatum]|nr:hypothetical protein O6H91_Y518900 [Diphasiastrum complanatum]